MNGNLRNVLLGALLSLILLMIAWMKAGWDDTTARVVILERDSAVLQSNYLNMKVQLDRIEQKVDRLLVR